MILKRMLLRSFFVTVALLFSVPSFAQDEAWTKDITADLVQFMSSQFVGRQAGATKTWDYTELGVGKKVKGEGSATVNGFINSTGMARHVFFKSDNEIMSNHVKTDNLALSYTYQGATIGRTYGYPGGSFVHHEWGWMHPTGTITAKIYANPTRGYRIEISYTVQPGGDSRAQEVVEKAAYELRYAFAERLAAYMTGVLGMAVQVDL